MQAGAEGPPCPARFQARAPSAWVGMPETLALCCGCRNPDLAIDPETGEPIEAEAPNDVRACPQSLLSMQTSCVWRS